MRLKALGYRLLLELDPLKTKSSGGIILTETRQDKAARNVGTVVAIGPDCWSGTTPWAKVGDKILFTRYGAVPIVDPEQPDREFVLINDSDALCGYDMENAA